ncbi:MAG TPA: FAD-dependent oxidoreductase [Methylomirabilota bacterium]|nr:FAD-dependent oxidoreductase [Methylomirabilota bacterium]
MSFTSRRGFLKGAVVGAGLLLHTSARAAAEGRTRRKAKSGLRADVVIAGGSLGGCAAALACLRNGLSVILTEETDWIGGQLTSQGVPPDEHQWIEAHGCTRAYRDMRNRVRDYYRAHYPLTEEARKRDKLNPGDGTVSRLCHEPRVALAVLEGLLAPYQSAGRLQLLLEHEVVAAEVDGDKVRGVIARDLRTGNEVAFTAPFFLDATELGDLLPLTNTEFVVGAEAASDTGELHAARKRDPKNQQAFTICFALDYDPNAEHVIEKPKNYEFWQKFEPKLTPPWPGRLLDLTYTHPPTLKPRALGFNPLGPTPGAVNLWLYRRILNKNNFTPGAYVGDISLVNWPQNDYLLGNLVGVSKREQQKHIAQGRELSLALVYWLQTECPRPDGGTGWPGLRLRGDVMGTRDVAKYPYVRESRRAKTEFTVLEQHIGTESLAQLTGKPVAEVRAQEFSDSVGVGSYPIDLHPTSTGDNYIDFPTKPFQIPLGALLPVRMENLIPACKNIGTTHVTNGCYRLHPVEWNIGESAGLLAAFALRKKTDPRAVRANPQLLNEFQDWIRSQGVETHWPKS